MNFWKSGLSNEQVSLMWPYTLQKCILVLKRVVFIVRVVFIAAPFCISLDQKQWTTHWPWEMRLEHLWNNILYSKHIESRTELALESEAEGLGLINRSLDNKISTVTISSFDFEPIIKKGRSIWLWYTVYWLKIHSN